MAKKKENKSIFSGEFQSELYLEHDTPIYIRDNITNFKMKLFKKCKDISQKYNIQFLWINESQI